MRFRWGGPGSRLLYQATGNRRSYALQNRSWIKPWSFGWKHYGCRQDVRASAKEGDDDRFTKAKSNAAKASEVIGRFLHHFPSEGHKASIIERLRQLDLAIDGLRSSEHCVDG